jgi:hypothetical protein
MATMFKHLKPHATPSKKVFPPSLPIAPTVTTIVVDCVSIVNPQLTPIIRNNGKPIIASPEKSH